MTQINKILLDKYNKPVPRYTSYPPANHFLSSFTEHDYLNLLKTSNTEKPEHIAFYIHIPFCKKICFYCGCNTCNLGNGNQIKPYIDALKKEIKYISQHIDKKRLVSQIHYGGGTPNAIPSVFIKEVNDIFFTNFKFIEKPEIAIECNPAYLDFQYLQDLKEVGFNRFSLGIQDFNVEVLKTVNRDPAALPVKDIIAFLKKDGNVSVNLDFIYGLPLQTIDSFTKTITKAIEIKPDRLVTFSYAHVPWMKKHQHILEKTGLPNAEEKTNMFLKASELLKVSGYKAIGLDHYVLPQDELYTSLINHQLHRNFQGYCTRRTTGQVYAFGVSSISQLSGGYSQNAKDIDTYISQINHDKLAVEKGCKITAEENITREIINQLMCNYKINWNTISANLGIDKSFILRTAKIKNTILEDFAKDGLIDYNDEEISVLEKGHFFVRNIAASFDPAYVQQDNKYSKSV